MFVRNLSHSFAPLLQAQPLSQKNTRPCGLTGATFSRLPSKWTATGRSWRWVCRCKAILSLAGRLRRRPWKSSGLVNLNPFMGSGTPFRIQGVLVINYLRWGGSNNRNLEKDTCICMAEYLRSSPEATKTLLIGRCCSVAQSYPTLCDPMDCSYTPIQSKKSKVLGGEIFFNGNLSFHDWWLEI